MDTLSALRSDEPARIVVVHGRSAAFHYPERGPAAWRALERRLPWVEFRHRDERDLADVRTAVRDRRAHGLIVASGALQIPDVREVFADDGFRSDLTDAVEQGMGVLVLRQYLGHGASVRPFRDDSTASGEILHVGARLRPARFAETGHGLLGLTGADRTMIESALHEAAGRDRATDGVWGAWIPDLPDRWTVQLDGEHEGRTLVVLGYTEVGRGRITMSSLPLEVWGVEDLLATLVVQTIRPSGLVCAEVGARVEDDVDLLLARNAHVAAGGFSVRLRREDAGGLRGDDRCLTQFRHLLVAGADLHELTGIERRDVRRRLENGGSITTRVATGGGPFLVRFREPPAYLMLAQQLESWFLRRFSAAPQLMTFDLLAAARLAVAVRTAFEDGGAIPPNLRPEFIRSVIEPLALRRFSADADVDGLAIPTLTVAATLRMLDARGGPDVGEVLARVDALGDDTEPAQARYLRALAAPDYAPVLRTGQSASLWDHLIALRHGGQPPDAQYLRTVALDAADELAAALLVLEAAGSDRVGEIDQEQLGRLVAMLQRTLSQALRGETVPVEAVLLAGAALIGLAARLDETLAPGLLVPIDIREAHGMARDTEDPVLAEAGWRELLNQELASVRGRLLAEQQERDEELRSTFPTLRLAVLGSATLVSSTLAIASVVSVSAATAAGPEAMWGAIGVLSLVVPAALNVIWRQRRPFGALGMRAAEFLRPTSALLDAIRSSRRADSADDDRP